MTPTVRQRQCTDNGYRLRRIGKLLKNLAQKIVAYLQFSKGALFVYRRAHPQKMQAHIYLIEFLLLSQNSPFV